MQKANGHLPVMLQECIEGLQIKSDAVIIDGTLGGGGHSRQILQQLGPEGKLIGIDKDEDAIERCQEKLGQFDNKILVRDDFKNIKGILKELGIEKIDGALLDLGVSSYQLDEQERGFSYNQDAPLDMRMDRRQQLSAWQVVNEYPEEALRSILRDYGEEKFAHRIAQNMVAARKIAPIETTGQLAKLVEQSIPKKTWAGKGSPCKRTFQAIRIEVNGELKELKQTVEDFIDVLGPRGRLAVITFHSLEDRIVKNAFKEAMDPCICPKDFPVCVCGRVSKGKVVTRKPILPTPQEMEKNKRSKSAKLRIFERAE